MKDFFGNPIPPKPSKINANYPARAITVCKILLLIGAFIMASLRACPTTAWDLRVKVKGKWELHEKDFQTKTECEARAEFLRMNFGYIMECKAKEGK